MPKPRQLPSLLGMKQDDTKQRGERRKTNELLPYSNIDVQEAPKSCNPPMDDDDVDLLFGRKLFSTEQVHTSLPVEVCLERTGPNMVGLVGVAQNPKSQATCRSGGGLYLVLFKVFFHFWPQGLLGNIFPRLLKQILVYL